MGALEFIRFRWWHWAALVLGSAILFTAILWSLDQLWPGQFGAQSNLKWGGPAGLVTAYLLSSRKLASQLQDPPKEIRARHGELILDLEQKGLEVKYLTVEGKSPVPKCTDQVAVLTPESVDLSPAALRWLVETQFRLTNVEAVMLIGSVLTLFGLIIVAVKLFQLASPWAWVCIAGLLVVAVFMWKLDHLVARRQLKLDARCSSTPESRAAATEALQSVFMNLNKRNYIGWSTSQTKKRARALGIDFNNN